MPARQNLVFDADDTLWDSNIHFLEAFDEFVRACNTAGLAHNREFIKAAVRAAELELIKTHGYGREPYILALHRATDALVENGSIEALRAAIDKIGSYLVDRYCALLPGVEETVRELANRHRLILFTKGQRDEQMRKLMRCGLLSIFDRVETPREKDTDAYHRLIQDAELHPEASWMIGNSPRSDINPAIRAGLRAVYIPHPHTWELEQEELEPSDRMIQIDDFRQLLELF